MFYENYLSHNHMDLYLCLSMQKLCIGAVLIYFEGRPFLTGIISNMTTWICLSDCANTLHGGCSEAFCRMKF